MKGGKRMREDGDCDARMGKDGGRGDEDEGGV